MTTETDVKDGPSNDRGHSKDTQQRTPRHKWRQNGDDVRRWADLFKSGITILRIAERENVDPGTVSQQLHRLGFSITRGHHMVQQLPLKYSPQFIELIDKGPDAVLEFVKNRVWGISATGKGQQQVRTFCEFVRLHHQGTGVEEIGRRLSLHRTTVAEWRDGTDQPYLIKAIGQTLPITLRDGWKLLPMHLTSGGSDPSGWIQVPESINSYKDILDVTLQIEPLEETFEHARLFGLSRLQVESMRPELLAYLLGIILGDSGKHGGAQNRYASMNLDLQLTLKHQTNERLGEFVIMCANSLGIPMDRIKDKPPTGQTALGKHPSAAYRWTSERSPLFAWMFAVGLGLRWGETTTTNQVRMDWIFDTPESFRRRFVQGTADSDGCARKYVVDIASVPNADFLARLLRSLGMKTACVAYENGLPLRTKLLTKEAAALPIFNEFVKSYRYQRMMSWAQT